MPAKFFLIIIFLSLASCGQKGPLFIDTPEQQDEQTAEPASPEDSEQNNPQGTN